MPISGISQGLGLGGGAAATIGGALSGGSLDPDAASYFGVLEGTSGWSEPTDYADKQAAISDYFIALKAAGNWADLACLYFPIWQAPLTNAINAKQPGTYNITWENTVYHTGGDYVYGDGVSSGGCGIVDFWGPSSSSSPRVFGLKDFCWGGNVLDRNASVSSGLCGWYFEGAIRPYGGSGTYFYVFKPVTSNSTGAATEGLYVAQSDSTSSSATAGMLYRDGTLMEFPAGSGTTLIESTTSGPNASGCQWCLLAQNYWIPAPYGRTYQNSKYHVNLLFAGTQLSSASDFNTDTATFLAAI